MASEKQEDPMNNTAGTDEETVAQRRKRLRRVSFADREITSVHIFNRDEDYETPPNSSASKPQNGEPADTSGSEYKVIRFFGDLADMEATEGDGDAEEDAVSEKSFLRPKSSPSSGGSTIGSASSDDEDNFFGPVSSHFINPGRLSDATISEEHHDVTMDSTAFSMHFRSLAMSEPGDVKTPMSSHLPVEDKTPTQVSSRSATGSAMALTEPMRVFSKSPLPVDNRSGGGDSNDMSIVGENSRKYDYGHISPTLAALLGDESKELPPASGDNSVNARSPIHELSFSPQNGCFPLAHAYVDTHGTNSNDASQMLSPNGSGYHHQIGESGSQRYTKEASISSSNIRKQSAPVVGIFPQPLPFFTPSPKQGGGFMSRETLALVESLSTMKSKSRLGLILPSPGPGSALSQRIEKSKLQLSKSRPVTTPPAIGREDISVCWEKHGDIPITNLEDLLSEHGNISDKKGTPDTQDCGTLSPAVVISNNFACTIQEGNTNSGIEGSLLRQQQINQTASTPEKFVSSPAGSPILKSGLKTFVTLPYQEQQSKATGNSETGDGNVTKDCASNDSLSTLSEKVDSLLAESGVLLSESGFLNGSAQPKEKVIVSDAQFILKSKNDNEVHCEADIIPTDDLPAAVSENLPGTPDSSSMNRSKDEASHAEGESRLKRKADDVDLIFRNCSPKVGKSTHSNSSPVIDHPDGNHDAKDCRVVSKEVWKVESLGESDGCKSIILNYSGLIKQRLTLKPTNASFILISNSLSDKFIKNFPDMNLSVAFNSLFNTEYSQKYVDGLLLETTQKTSLLLCNLLDVAEELQLAWMEMPNLVQGSFDSSSEGQLHLRISFIDCKSFRKMTMILDMTCLTHGKYPGEITPCELLETSGPKRDGVVPKQLTNDIESAMVDVGVGYPRILRICRCVSNVLQSRKGEVSFST